MTLADPGLPPGRDDGAAPCQLDQESLNIVILPIEQVSP